MPTAYFFLTLIDPHCLTVRLPSTTIHHPIIHGDCDQQIEPLINGYSSDLGIPYQTVYMAGRSQRHNVVPTHSLDPAAVWPFFCPTLGLAILRAITVTGTKHRC
jgi:hypothetical protein